jgi:putative phage-type endonuclease
MTTDINIINAIDEIPAFEYFSPEEIENLEIEIHQWINNYMRENVLKLPRPDFMDTLVDELMEDFYVPLFDSIDTNSDMDDSNFIDYDDFEYIISFFIQNFFKINYPDSMPPRYSLKHWKQKKSTEEINSIREKINWASNVIQPVQRTPEWYTMRYNLITASNIWKAMGSDANKNSIIYEKCRPLVLSDTEKVNVLSATHWGVRYEPVTVMLYEKLFKTKIGEFGCIQHPSYPFIGASPDGINIDPESPKYGTMLEIKNIVNREIDGNPKLEYWIQTQIQMEVCNLEDCDFVETQFKEYEDCNEDLFYSARDSHLWNGVILYFIERGFASERPHYVYMPMNIELEKECVNQWINEQKELLTKDYVLYRRIYWYCEVFSCVNIRRNREWFSAVLPEVESVWRIIEHERIHGYEHRKPKSRIRADNDNDTGTGDNNKQPKKRIKPMAPPPQSLFDDFREENESLAKPEKTLATEKKTTATTNCPVITTAEDTNFFEGDILRI